MALTLVLRVTELLLFLHVLISKYCNSHWHPVLVPQVKEQHPAPAWGQTQWVLAHQFQTPWRNHGHPQGPSLPQAKPTGLGVHGTTQLHADGKRPCHQHNMSFELHHFIFKDWFFQKRISQWIIQIDHIISFCSLYIYSIYIYLYIDIQEFWLQPKQFLFHPNIKGTTHHAQQYGNLS